MRRLILSSLLMAVLGLFAATRAQADGSPSTPMDVFTYTNSAGTYVWELPASPPPDFSMDGVLFEIDNVQYTLGTMMQPPAIFDFFSADLGGGFQISLSTNDVIVDAFGMQLYMNGEDMPTFLTGKFTLQDGSADGPDATLKIAAAEQGVPEPSALLLTGTGMLVLLGLTRKKLAA
jgi:hypothetical protein